MKLGAQGFAVLSLFVLSACGNLAIDDTCECGFFATRDQRPLIWPAGKRDLKFYVHNTVPAAAVNAVRRSVSNYTSALGDAATLTVEVDSTSSPIHGRASLPSRVNGDGINGIYWINGDWPFATESGHEDGMTLILFSKNGIAEADIFIRGGSFKATASNPASTVDFEAFDVESASSDEQLLYLLMTHEFGHALGRTHSQEPDSIMRPTVNLNSLRAPLSSHDFSLFERAYQ